MSNNIALCDWVETGVTIYGQIRNRAGQVWNGSAFEAYATANIATYATLATEQGTASKVYSLTFPAVAAGRYFLSWKKRAGSAVAEADLTIDAQNIEWDSTEILTATSFVRAETPTHKLKVNVAGRAESDVQTVLGAAPTPIAEPPGGIASIDKQDATHAEVEKIPRKGYKVTGENVTPGGDYLGETEIVAYTEVEVTT